MAPGQVTFSVPTTAPRLLGIVEQLKAISKNGSTPQSSIGAANISSAPVVPPAIERLLVNAKSSLSKSQNARPKKSAAPFVPPAVEQLLLDAEGSVPKSTHLTSDPILSTAKRRPAGNKESRLKILKTYDNKIYNSNT